MLGLGGRLTLAAQLLAALLTGGDAVDGHAAKEFKIGDEFSVECQTGDSEKPWGPGPICDETGKELTFRYGQATNRSERTPGLTC